MNYSLRQIKAIENEYKKKLLSLYPNIPETSGIYFLLRSDDDFKFAYVGKAKNLLTRLAQHLRDYKQRVDISLKKRGFYNGDNQGGWKVYWLEIPESELDEKERFYIKKYASAGYQMYNVESGGQSGKTDIGERKATKGYRDGLEQGYKNAQRFVARLFEKHLDYRQKSDKPNKNQEKAAEKFREFLEVDYGKAEDICQQPD